MEPQPLGDEELRELWVSVQGRMVTGAEVEALFDTIAHLKRRPNEEAKMSSLGEEHADFTEGLDRLAQALLDHVDSHVGDISGRLQQAEIALAVCQAEGGVLRPQFERTLDWLTYAVGAIERGVDWGPEALKLAKEAHDEGRLALSSTPASQAYAERVRLWEWLEAQLRDWYAHIGDYLDEDLGLWVRKEVLPKVAALDGGAVPTVIDPALRDADAPGRDQG